MKKELTGASRATYSIATSSKTPRGVSARNGSSVSTGKRTPLPGLPRMFAVADTKVRSALDSAASAFEAATTSLKHAIKRKGDKQKGFMFATRNKIDQMTLLDCVVNQFFSIFEKIRFYQKMKDEEKE